eukprot:g4377.t1
MGRSRERGRGRGRGGFRFDSPPRDNAGKPVSAAKEPAAPLGVTTTTFNIWNPKPDAIVSNYPTLQNIIAASRELDLAADCQMALSEVYFANLPPGITAAQLKKFINGAAKVLRIGNRNFAWVTFKKDRWAMLSLQMHGLFLGGKKLRVGRTYAQVRDGKEDAVLLQQELALLNPDTANLTVGEMQAASSLMLQQSGGGTSTATGMSAHQQFAQMPRLVMSTLAPGITPSGSVMASTSGVLGALMKGTGAGEKSYPPGATGATGSTGLIAGGGLGFLGEQKLCLSNIPTAVSEEKVSQLLKTFGPLKYFHCVVLDGEETMACFFEFQDFFTQKNAPATLKGLTLGGRELKVITPEEAFKLGLGRGKISVGERVIVTKILYITNFISDEDLRNDDEYDEICKDIREECESYGTVLELLAPRPSEENKQKYEDLDLRYEMDRKTGVGYCFVVFQDLVSCAKAQRDFDGRAFGEFKMSASFLNEKQFAERDFHTIKPNTTAQDVIEDEEAEMDMSQ